MQLCTVDDCTRPLLWKGLCSSHYYRDREYGDALAPLKRSPQARIDWLLAAIAVAGDECIDWPWGTTRGYGTITDIAGRKHVYATRFVCEQVYGPPPGPRIEAAHSCRRPICVNPNHLRWATSAENERDKIIHGTSNRGEHNGSHKLTETQVYEIRDMAAAGVRHRSIAAKFDVSLKTVRNVHQRRHWSWLP